MFQPFRRYLRNNFAHRRSISCCYSSFYFSSSALALGLVWLFLTFCFPCYVSWCRLESAKGTYAVEWTKWEKQLRSTLIANSEYLNSVQVIYFLVTDGSKKHESYAWYCNCLNFPQYMIQEYKETGCANDVFVFWFSPFRFHLSLRFSKCEKS